MEADLLRIILDWKIILILVVVIIVLPTIFYFASLDKSAVKLKKVKVTSQKNNVDGEGDRQQQSENSEPDKGETSNPRDRSIQTEEKR